MNFDLSTEQEMLRDSVCRLLARCYGAEHRRRHMAEPGGWAGDAWQRYAELGLLALPFRSHDGGFDGTPVEQMIVMEAFGRFLTLEPYLATVVLCGSVLRRGANDEQRAALVPCIADGSLTLALAYAERQSSDELREVKTIATRSPEGWTLEGGKAFVLHGGTADKFIVSARIAQDRHTSEGISLFLVDARADGVSRRSYATHDQRNMADVKFSGVRLAPEALIGPEGGGLLLLVRAVEDGNAALCAEAVGVMDRALEITVEYLKVRRQFGAAIGSFQALRHRAVDMLVRLEQARSMAIYAAASLDETDAERRALALSAAKVMVSRSARWIGQQAVQLHGAIGLTEECEIGHCFRRLSVLEPLLGDARHHLALLARSPGVLTSIQHG